MNTTKYSFMTIGNKYTKVPFVSLELNSILKNSEASRRVYYKLYMRKIVCKSID
jgi:hypothetical protein